MFAIQIVSVVGFAIGVTFGFALAMRAQKVKQLGTLLCMGCAYSLAFLALPRTAPAKLENPIFAVPVRNENDQRRFTNIYETYLVKLDSTEESSNAKLQR